MTITVKAARDALEAAHLAYVQADIEHPIATLVAKEALTNARHEYWDACATFCEKAIKMNTDFGSCGNYSDVLNLVHEELWS
jgi:predicted HD phosphohydrolase